MAKPLAFQRKKPSIAKPIIALGIATAIGLGGYRAIDSYVAQRAATAPERARAKELAQNYDKVQAALSAGQLPRARDLFTVYARDGNLAPDDSVELVYSFEAAVKDSIANAQRQREDSIARVRKDSIDAVTREESAKRSALIDSLLSVYETALERRDLARAQAALDALNAPGLMTAEATNQMKRAIESKTESGLLARLGERIASPVRDSLAVELLTYYPRSEKKDSVGNVLALSVLEPLYATLSANLPIPEDVAADLVAANRVGVALKKANVHSTTDLVDSVFTLYTQYRNPESAATTVAPGVPVRIVNHGTLSRASRSYLDDRLKAFPDSALGTITAVSGDNEVIVIPRGTDPNARGSGYRFARSDITVLPRDVNTYISKDLQLELDAAFSDFRKVYRP
jgi:hypothetical protein